MLIGSTECKISILEVFTVSEIVLYEQWPLKERLFALTVGDAMFDEVLMKVVVIPVETLNALQVAHP
jgi:hypothetical protein